MRAITKSTAYAKLASIKNEGIDTSRYIRLLAGEETVPYDVLVFINKHSPLDQLSVYNHIYENRRKNPLYKNIVNENASIEDKALALSSILTQTIISCKKTSDNECFKVMNVDLILEALSDYTLKGSTSKLVDVSNGIRDIFKKLYK